MADPTAQISSAVASQNAADLPSLFAINPETDTAIIFLRSIFGPVIDYIVNNGNAALSSGESILGNAMGLLNSGLLLLGAIYIGWMGIGGAIHTANTGKFAGNSGWSPVWMTIRTIIGVGSLAPIAHGYGFLQIFILWVAIQGIAFANNIYGSVIDLIDKQGVISQTYASPDARDLAISILRSEVCTASFNLVQQEAGGKARFNIKTEETRSVDLATSFFSTVSNFFKKEDDVRSNRVEKVYGRYMWGDQTGQYYSPQVCGGIEINMESTEVAHASVQYLINDAHITGLNDMILTMRAAANKYVNEYAQETEFKYAFENSLIEEAALAYSDKIKAAAVNAVKGQEEFLFADFKEKATQGGFLTAGGWYFYIAKLNSEISSVIDNAPLAVNTNIDQDLTIFSAEAIRPFMAKVDSLETIVKNRDYAENLGSRVNRMQNGSDARASGLTDEFLKIITNPLAAAIDSIKGYVSLGTSTDSFSFLFNENEKSPLVQAKELGDVIVNTGELALVGIGTGAALSGVGAGNAAGKIAGTDTTAIMLVTMFTPFIFLFVMALFVFGISLSVYLPLVPYIIWIGAVLSLFLLIIEAVIAAPIWALAFLEPSGGEGPAGKAAQGWYLIVSLFVRPPLMIFGLLAAMLFSHVFIGFVNGHFFQVIQSVNAGSFGGIIKYIASIIIYVSVVLTTMHLVYSLITMIPDKILRWIGAGVEQLGEMGTEDKTRTTVAAGFSSVQRGANTAGRAGMADKSAKGGGSNEKGSGNTAADDSQHLGADSSGEKPDK